MKKYGPSKDRLVNALFIICVLITLVVITYFADKKASYFTDEIYSFGLSNSQDKTFINYESAGERWVSKDFFWSYVTVQEDQRFDYKAVWRNQASDVHPPLYYALIHTVCSFFPNVLSKWIGILLNIPFYIMAQVLLFSISKKYIKGIKAICPSFIWGISAVGVSSVIFIRMYVLLTFFMLLLSYIFLKIYENNHLQKRDYIILLATVAGGVLTQYYFLIFFAILAMSFLAISIICRDYKILLRCVCIVIVSGLLVLLIFPRMIYHIF